MMKVRDRRMSAFSALRTEKLGLLIGAMIVVAAVTSIDAAAEEATAITGRVVDANTGEPIEGAWVFQVVPADRLVADVRRFERVREAQTDAEGRFRFESEAPSLLDSLLSYFSSPPRPPRYHTYHDSYGLLWGRQAAGTIELSLRDSFLHIQEAMTLCGGRGDDAFHTRVTTLACPPARPDLFPNGKRRAIGDLDKEGRRAGPWQFYREDGSIIAAGQYAGGGPVTNWRYFPRPEVD